jgi:hypothetical protein
MAVASAIDTGAWINSPQGEQAGGGDQGHNHPKAAREQQGPQRPERHGGGL